MNTSSSPILQTENDRPSINLRCVRALVELDETDVVRFLNIVAPNPDEFDGMWQKGRMPTLYGEFIDPQGNRKWDVLRGADPRAALAAHGEAGQTQEPIAVEDNTQGPIRAVALRYDPQTKIEFFSIDLDGKYPAQEVLDKLIETFGQGTLLPHTGSGTEGRYRVLGRLDKPMTVSDMQTHLCAVAAYIGFPVKGGHLEISPGNQASRIPFGFGGCTLFDSQLRPIGEPDFNTAVAAFLNLKPIDLRSVVEKIGKAGIDTGIRRTESKGRYDAWKRKERARSRSRAMRRLLSEGITGHGQRSRAIYDFIKDSLFSGYTCAQSIERLTAWIEVGKLDASRDIQKYGRQWQIKQVERLVVRVFSTTAPLGIPDPIPLTSDEIQEVKRIAQDVASRSEYTVRRVERFLLRALPWFKGAAVAGLPMLRFHSKKWEAFDRDAVDLRYLVGLFRAETGYRSLASVKARAHLGARSCEAHARSYSCRFAFQISAFDAPSYLLSTGGERIVTSLADMPIDPPTIFVSNYPSTLDKDLPSPSSSSVDSSANTRTPQLYVRQDRIPYKTRGLDRAIRHDKTPEQTIQDSSDRPSTQTDATQPFPHTTLPSRRGPEKRSTSSRPASVLDERPKRPEWQIVKSYCAPCTPDMGIDEWFDACRAVGDEYKRERAEAAKDQKQIEREHGIKPSLGKVASERFHKLRKILGLDAWN